MYIITEGLSVVESGKMGFKLVNGDSNYAKKYIYSFSRRPKITPISLK